MQTSVTKQEDGKLLITFEHKGVTDTRFIDPILNDEQEEDEDLLSARIAELATAIEVKIDMGVITNDSIAMMNIEPLSVAPPRVHTRKVRAVKD